MKLLSVITKSEHGGAQSHLRTVLSGTADICEHVVVTGSLGDFAPSLANHASQLIEVPFLHNSLNPYAIHRAVAGLRQVIQKERPHLVHCHSSVAGIVGRIASRLESVPSIYTAHGWAFVRGAPIGRRLSAYVAETLCSRLSQFVICVAQSEVELASRLRVVPPTRLRLIHNGLPANAPQAMPAAAGEVVIISVSRFARPKRQDLIIRAFSALPPHTRLVLVGDGPLRNAAEALVASLGLSHRVSFLGTRADIPDLLATAHIFAMASDHEGFPIATLEAMRAGLPICASTVGGLPEQIHDGISGFLIPAEVEMWTSRLALLVSQPDIRSHFGSAARRSFLDRFSEERMIAELKSLYAEAAGL